MTNPGPFPATPASAHEWAEAFVTGRDMEAKLTPPPRPDLPGGETASAPAKRLSAPGRDPRLSIEESSKKAKTGGALTQPKRRAELIHRFLHHEVQAAELMAWAVLAFPDTPPAFRRGLFGILDDELRHANAYRSYLRNLGFDYGAFPVRDWFWERVPSVTSATGFVATMGMGLEGGNLDHTTRFAAQLLSAGDRKGSDLVTLVGDEEVSHVKFAVHWFREFTGEPVRFDAWRASLPTPLSPVVMKGPALDRGLRSRAGMDEAFLAALDAWKMTP
ncbi:MAG: DUF455 family protein [Polyangiaceae bacterium]